MFCSLRTWENSHSNRCLCSVVWRRSLVRITPCRLLFTPMAPNWFYFCSHFFSKQQNRTSCLPSRHNSVQISNVTKYTSHSHRCTRGRMNYSLRWFDVFGRCFIWNGQMGAFHFLRKRNGQGKVSERAVAHLIVPLTCTNGTGTRLLTHKETLPSSAFFFFFRPEACFLMISRYMHPSHSLSREHFWRILILVVPNHRAWLLCEIRGLETFLLLLIIPLLGFLGTCAPGNQELFTGSLHYIWCG